MSCIPIRKKGFTTMITRQRALEILFYLSSNEKAFAYMKQDHIFLFHAKKLLSVAEQGLQLAAQAVVEKLSTCENSIDILREQMTNTNISDDVPTNNNDEIIISYSPDDHDICYRIGDQLVSDSFRVNLRRLNIQERLNHVKCSQVKNNLYY